MALGSKLGIYSSGSAVTPIDFPPQTGLVRAYSTSRKLVDGYAGDAYTVRRTSNDNELDIGFTAGGLVNEAALEAFVFGASNDGFSPKLYDQTDNLDLVQGNASRQLQVVENGQALKDAGGILYADALSDNRKWGSGGGIVNVVGAWFMVVHRQANTGVDAVYFARGVGNPVDRWNLITRTAVNDYRAQIAGNILNSSPKDTNQHLFTGFQDGSTAEFYRDGSLAESVVDGPGAIPAMSLMARSDGASGVDGFFYEFLVYDDTMTASRTDIETNINDFYGIF